MKLSVAAFLLTLVVAAPFVGHAQNAAQPSYDFEKRSFAAKGAFHFEQTANGNWEIVLSEDFSTKDGPDLKLFLTDTDAKALNGRNAAANALRVGVLQSSKGSQRYALPEGTNPNDYENLIIHCEAYSKLWAVGEID